MKKPKSLLALLLTTALLAQTPAGVSAAGGADDTGSAPPSVSEAASVSASDESVSENASGEHFFSGTYIPDTSALPESDSLYDGYIEQQINARTGYGIATVGTTARDTLSGTQQAIYDELKTGLLKITDGTATSAEFSISAEVCAQIPPYTNANYPDLTTENGKKVLVSNYPNQIQNNYVNPSKIVNALLADCPFDFYWYDRNKGYKFEYEYGVDSEDKSMATVTSLTFKFYVATEYAAGSTEGTFTADSTKLPAATGSLDNAQKVVAENENKTDYEKLVAYRDYICDAVTYDIAVASVSEYQQMLNVFDDDNTTNAVCAGYSRAFQYLCELTDWTGDVVCYSMTGTLKEGTDGTAESHMWNVVGVEGISCPTGVSLHDGNYITDITNCDTGAIGEDGGLFLDQHVINANLSRLSSLRNMTLTVGDSSLIYTYDESLKDLYCSGYLPLRAGVRIMRNTSNLNYWGIQKNYDGTTDCSLPDTSKLPFSFYYEDGYNVDPSVTLSVSGAYDSADVGNNKKVIVTVMLDEAAQKNYYFFYNTADETKNVSSADVSLSDGTTAHVTITILSESSFQFTYDQASITKAFAPEWNYSGTTRLQKDENGKIWIKDLPTTAEHTFTLNGQEYTVKGDLTWYRDPQAEDKYENDTEIVESTWGAKLFCTFTISDDTLADNKYFSGVTYPEGYTKTCPVAYTTYGGPIGIELMIGGQLTYGSTLSVVAVADTDGLEGYNAAEEIWTYSYSGTLADGNSTAYGPTSEEPTEPGRYTVTARCECGAYKGSGNKTFTIAPAQLSFAGILANDKEYDGTTAAKVYGELKYTGIKNNDEVYPDISSITGYYDSFQFADAEIGTQKLVTSSISLIGNTSCTLLAGADAWKYKAPTAEPKAYAEIRRVRPKIDLTKLTPDFYLNNQTRVYDGTVSAPALSYTFADPDTTEEVTVTFSGNTYADANVGENKIITLNTASVEERYGDTYNFTYPENLTGSITQRSLDAHIEGDASAVYDSSFMHTVELNYSADLISGDDPGFNLTYYDSEGKPLSGVPTAPGSYTIKCTVTNGNYKLGSCADKSFTITKATPAYTDLYPTMRLRYNFTGTKTVTAADFGITASGTLKITQITDNKSILVSDSGVGDTFPYSFTIADRVNPADWATIGFTFTPADENYETLEGILKIELTGLSEIAPSDLSVSMENSTYGESLADPTVSFDSSGYPDIDLTDGAWSYYYTGTTLAPDATSVYDSYVKPTAPGNYTVTATYSCATHTGTVTADFSIARKQLSYTGITPKNKVYDGTVNAGLEGGLSYEGVLTGDTVIPSTALAATQPVFFFEDADAGTGKRVFLKNADGSELSITMAGPSAWKYLAPEALPEYTADITPQAVGFNAYTNVTTDFDKVYDGSCDAPDVTMTFEGVERDGTITVTFTGNTFSDKNVGGDKAYIFGTAVSETNLANYELVSPRVTGTITQRDLTVSIEGPESVVYGEDFSHTARVLSGQQSGDSFEELRLRIRYYTPDHRNTYDAVTNAGTYEPYVTLGNRNYNLIVTGGPESFTIIQATPTLNTEFEPLYRYDDTSTHMLTLEDLNPSVPGEIHLLSYSDLLDAASTDHLLAARPTTDDENYIAFALREGLTPEDEDRWALINFQFEPLNRNYRRVNGTLLLRVSTKYPINDITVSVADATYGETPVNPVCSFDASALSGFDDTNGTWTFECNGYFFDSEQYRTFYESTELPTLPGEYRLTATYESDSHKGFKRIHFTIRKKELSYTGLTAKKPYDGLTAVSFTDDSSLTYDGVVDGDVLDAPVDYRTEGVTYTYADAEIGSGKQILTNYSEKNTLSGPDAWKYTLGELVLTGEITNPENPVLVGSADQMLISADTDAEYAALLASLPEGLYADVAALKNALYQAALNGFTLSDGFTFNTLFYDFQIWTRNADGSQGTRLFDSGADILLPYPAGTDQSFPFVLVHMLSDGSLETLPVSNTAHGIRFTTASASPFVLGWMTADAVPDDSDNGNGNSGSNSGNGSNANSAGNSSNSGGNSANSAGNSSNSGNSGNGSAGNGRNTGSGSNSANSGSDSSNSQALTTPVPPTARNDQDETTSSDSASSGTDAEEKQSDGSADADNPSQSEEAPSLEAGEEQTDGETDAVVIPADEKSAGISHTVPVLLLIILLLGVGTLCVIFIIRNRKGKEA